MTALLSSSSKAVGNFVDLVLLGRAELLALQNAIHLFSLRSQKLGGHGMNVKMEESEGTLVLSQAGGAATIRGDACYWCLRLQSLQCKSQKLVGTDCRLQVIIASYEPQATTIAGETL